MNESLIQIRTIGKNRAIYPSWSGLLVQLVKTEVKFVSGITVAAREPATIP
jgi:hypothetical protein